MAQIPPVQTKATPPAALEGAWEEVVGHGGGHSIIEVDVHDADEPAKGNSDVALVD